MNPKAKKVIYKFLTRYELFNNIILPYYSYHKNRRRLFKKIIPNLSKQILVPGLLNNVQTKGTRILIPYVETGHYCLYMMLVIAKALQLRGANVKFLYCDKMLNACEVINVHNKDTDVCRNCLLNQKHLLPMFGLDTCALSECLDLKKIKLIHKEAQDVCKNYPERFIYRDIDLISMVNDSVMRYYYGGETKDKTELHRIRAQHLSTAMISADVAKKLCETFKPDIILSLMYVYSAFQPYFDYYNKHSVRTITVDMTYEDDQAVQISPMDHFFSNDRFKAFVKMRKGGVLTEHEKTELFEYLKKRFSGNTLFFRSRVMFDDEIDVVEKLKINKNKRNIFLFSNLFWDVGLSQRGRLYDNVIEWVLSTIEMAKDNNGCHFYIKPHPVEEYDSTASGKGVSEYIYAKYRILPSNISIIPPEMKIPTYKLFPYIDMGVVFSGTLGIEMVLNDIPVAVMGKAPYGGLGFCHEPRTLEEYRDIMFGKEHENNKVNKEYVYLYCYFHFIKRIIPFNTVKPVYSNDNFEKYNIDSLEDLLPGKDYYLDHICDCILDNKLPESWV